MNRVQNTALILLLAVGGCLGRSDVSRQPATELEQEVYDGLAGVDYRLRRLRADETSDLDEETTIAELRRQRDELRRELDRLIATRDTVVDSTGTALRQRLEDLAVRYETARLGRFESRQLFEQAVEARFEDLDRELAFLEADVVQEELEEQFDGTLARLYRFRNEVALRVAETAVWSDLDFPRMKGELAAGIGKLDIMIAHATIEVDRAYELKHPIRSLNKLWL